MKTGIELITEERLDQIAKHGFTTELDKANNTKGQLILLVKYLLMSENDAERDNLYEFFEENNYNMKFINKFNGKTEVEKLAIAGALIAAQLDILINE